MGASDYPVRDPINTYNFVIEIGAIIQGNFKECSGLEASRNVIEYREGHERQAHVRKLPGMRTHGNITLKRGLVDGKELWAWFDKNPTDDKFQQDIDIVLYNDAFAEVLRWKLRDAWPVRWSGPSLDAASGDMAMEELEIAHNGLSQQAAE